MKILIIEDNPLKYQTTLRYVKEAQPNAEVTWEEYAKGGVKKLLSEDFDSVIIDMYMPISKGGRIDREGGLYVLSYMRRRNLDLSTAVVNSSEASNRGVMSNKGYKEVAFIHNSSVYDCSEDFKRFLNN